ncbi:MAG: TetR/AcrR family transcriptional regulator, partial [Bacteroidetes bacterium]|nr:TetR/AcrR family transcriptional regulator [Bacteroidota bacterium]
ISKKTLYQYFNTKAELVESIMLNHLNSEKDMCCNLVNEVENAIDQLHEIFKFNMQMMRSINPSTIFELRKYYPSVWKHFDQHKNQVIYHSVLENLKLGQKQGLYRTDLDPEIISRLYTGRMELIVDGETFPTTKFSFLQIMKELFIYHIRGIASEKGIKHLETSQSYFE